MTRSKMPFRPRSNVLALEPRLLFDGAGAVAAADTFDHGRDASAPESESQAAAPATVAATADPASDSESTAVVKPQASLEAVDANTAAASTGGGTTSSTVETPPAGGAPLDQELGQGSESTELLALATQYDEPDADAEAALLGATDADISTSSSNDIDADNATQPDEAEDTAEAHPDEAVEESTSPGALLIIDSRVADHQALLVDLPSNTTVRVVGADESGIDAAGQELANGGSFSAIHIISHGTPGSLTLGIDTINSDTISGHSAALQSWASYLTDDADILLYGCDIAEGDTGQALVSQLAHLTSADIAASTNDTGSADKGGDWVLEAATGNIEATALAVAGYGELLAATSITDSGAASPRITAEDTPLAVTGLTVLGGANDVITLTIVTAGGTSNLGSVFGLTQVTGNDSSSIQIQGTISSVNSALANLAYTPSADQNSSTTGFAPSIALNVTSGGAGSLTVSNISVSAVNDAPDLSTQVNLEVSESGSNIAFSLDQLASSANALDVDIATGQQVEGQQMVVIDSLPAEGTLTYLGGAVAAGQVIPVSSLGDLRYTHNGSDIPVAETDSFNVTVSDGGGGQTSGAIGITLNPANRAPVISGSPSMIEGQVSAVAPTIDLGDSADSLATSMVEITAVNNGGQGTLFFDANDNGIVDAGEAIVGSRTFTPAEAADLGTRLRFSQDGTEPNLPSGVSSPTYTIRVTDSGGGEGVALSTDQTITIDVRPNNDDPTLSNAHAIVGAALPVDEGVVTTLTSAMLSIADVDRDPSDPTQTTPSNQLVYTVGTRPAEGELQLFVGGTAGPDGNGWIVLGDGGRFTQAQVDAGEVRYYQTTQVTADTLDTFTFEVRDSAFGDDVASDPTNPNPPGGREGGVRDTPTGPIATQTFHLNIAADNDPHVNPYTGDPRPATQGYGGANMTYSFVAVVPNPGNNSADWNEGNVNPVTDGYVITDGMLNYSVTRTDDGGTPANSGDDVSVVVPADQTMYSLTSPPPNGTIQRLVGAVWQNVPTNGQFTQADINNGSIRFVHDGSEDHIATFGYTVSDGTENNFAGTFAINVVPTNDRPTAAAGAPAQAREGDGSLPANTGSVVRLGASQLGMADVDQSQDGVGGEGDQDFLWFQVGAQPVDGGATGHGVLERWNGTDWVAVAPGEWLSSALLSASADGGTSGLRYVHDGSEPLTYTGGPRVTFSYTVRDDLADGGDPFATSAAPVADSSGTPQSNESTPATVRIDIIPVNDAPLIADKPSDGDPSIGATITNGGALTGANQVLENVLEGSTRVITSAELTAVDRDNTTTQRQFRITQTTTQGTVLLNGAALGVGSTFTQADIDAGRVSYRHEGNEINASTTDSLGTYNDYFQFVVNDGVLADSGTAGNDNVFLITLASANDAPTVTAPSGPINIDSTNPANNPVSGFSVDDPDLTNPATSTDFLQVTVRLRNSGGAPVTDYATGFAGGGVQLGYATGSSVVLTQDGVDNILQFQGTRAEVNAALAGLTVTFANDVDNIFELEVIVDDRIRDGSGALVTTGDDANGGEVNQGATPGGNTTAVDSTNYNWATTTTVPAGSGNIASDTVLLRASHTNDVPVFTGPTSFTVVEDVRSPVNTGAPFVVSDGESTAFGTPVTVTVSVPAGQGALYIGPTGTSGTRTPPGGQAVSISGQGTGTLTLTGRADDIEAVLNGQNFAGNTTDANTGLHYTSASNVNHDQNGAGSGNEGDVTLTLSFNEGPSAIGGDVGSGSVANTVADITTALTNTAINDAPTVASGNGAIPVAGNGVNSVTGFVVNDVDANNGYADGETDGVIQVTVRVLDAAGAPLPQASYVTLGIELNSTTPGVATVDGSLNGSTQALELRGTREEINTYLAGLQVTFANLGDSNLDTTYAIEVVADDRLRDAPGALTSGANGGASNQQTGLPAVPTTDTFDAYTTAVAAYNVYNVTSGTRDLFISSINDPGQITASNVTVNEGSATLVLAGATSNFNLADSDDNGATTMEVTVTVGAGTITAVGGAGGTVSGTGTNTITITGATEAQINARLNAITVTFPDVPGDATSADWNGSFDVTVVYNDMGNTGTRPASLVGDTDNPRAGNGDYAYEDNANNHLITTRIITVTVDAVNDAPTRTGTGVATLPAGTEDTDGSVGNSVSALFGGAFVDSRDAVGDGTNGSVANTFAGIAITTNNAIAGQGVWQYSTDGGSTWTALPAVSAGNAFLLAQDATLRFNPTDDFHGTPGTLGARLVDNSQGAVTTGSTADVSGINSGASTRFSDASNAVSLGTTVVNVNDRPTGSNAMLPAIGEDATNPPGATVLSLFGPDYGDASDNQTAVTGGGDAATAFGGVAIVGDTANPVTEGQWQYSTDGGTTWTGVGTPGDGSALVLPTTAGLRFLPVTNYNGTPPALDVRLADTPVSFGTGVDLGLSAVESNNGTSTWSEIVTLGTTVTSVNEPVTVKVPDDRTQTTPDGSITDQVVFESGLPGGSGPNANDLVVDSSFTIAVPDGFPVAGAAVSVGYINASGIPGTLALTTAQVQALATTNQTITTPYGNLVIDGYTAQPNGTVTIDYTYTLNQPPSLSVVDTLDTFTITANDSNGDSDSSQTLNIKIVDDVPTANADTNRVDKEVGTVSGNVVTGASTPDRLGADGPAVAGPVTGIVAGSSTAGPVSTGVGSSVTGAYGTVTLLPDGSYTYVVDPANADVLALANGASLSDVFTYTITDADGDTSTTTLTIGIDGNLRPVADDDTFTTDEDTPLSGSLLANDTLGDGSAADHTWDKLTDPANGTVVVNPDGTFVYTPNPNFNGTDSFTYTVTDRDGNTSTATVNLTVTSVNDVPVAVNDRTTTGYQTPVSGSLVGNDTPSGDGGNVWTQATPPSNGRVVVNPDGTYRYTPNPGFSGTDSFTYTITDANGDTSTATMTITVAAGPVVPAPQPPEAPLPPLDPRPGISPALPPVPDVLLQPLNPLQGDQAREESVYFDGGVFNRVARLPIPMHPVVYVTPGVHDAQAEREATDTRYFSDPSIAHHGDVESSSIGAGLGMDPVVFVQHAVRDSQARSAWLDEVVNGRLGRISLGSDGMIRTPEWFEPLPENIVPEMPGERGVEPRAAAAPDDAQKGDAKEASSASAHPVTADRTGRQGGVAGAAQRPASAPSFSEQLRSSADRAPVAN